MGTISWQEAIHLAEDGGVVEMSFSCAEGRTGIKRKSGWDGHFEGRPSVTGKVTKKGKGLLFPNGQTIKREDFNWEGDSDDGDINLFSQNPEDWDCCETSISIVSTNSCSRKEQVMELYASIVKEARSLGFTGKDWEEANNKADA